MPDGYKTRQRERILQFLTENRDRHLSAEDVAAHLGERLARLGLPDRLIAPTAAALAGEAACLVPTEEGTAILAPPASSRRERGNCTAASGTATGACSLSRERRRS